jgi:hypothetical protein
MRPSKGPHPLRIRIEMNNSTFCSSEPSWANACVGENGCASYVEYSKGFSMAANLLIDRVIDYQGKDYSLDYMIYPACFNMRHSVELRLKGSIEELQKIAEIKKDSLPFDLQGSHNIEKIWIFFQDKSEKIDKRYIDINKKIGATIKDIAEVDPTGQTFRYAVDKDSQTHLNDVGVINFFILKRKFSELECNLGFLHEMNTYLLEEYRQGSFTKNISRPELFKMARKLPPIKNWRDDPNFKSIKDSLKDSYNISSRELTKAINIIKDHYEISPIIAHIPNLRGVTEEQIILFVDEWIKLNEEVKHRRSEAPMEISGIDCEKLFEGIMADDKIIYESTCSLYNELTPEFIAGINSLFIFSPRSDGFSEVYIANYEYELNKAKTYLNKSISTFINRFDKSNLLENILMSLFFLNYSSIAERIIERYEVSNSFSWIEAAKSRSLFEKPSYCGY